MMTKAKNRAERNSGQSLGTQGERCREEKEEDDEEDDDDEETSSTCCA